MVLIYPRNLPGLACSKVRRPKHNVSVQTHQSGGEVRMSYWSEPLWEWDLAYEILRDGFRMGHAFDELKQIEGCFLACTGSLSGMSFYDEDDNSAVQSGLGTTDGTTTAYTLIRYRGTGGEGESYIGAETIGFLDTTQPFNLYVDGAPVDISDPTYGYMLNTATPKNQRLVFTNAPPAGHALACDMSWLYYVRFQTDSQDFEKFMHQLWGLNKITLCSLRY
ncbi:MAG TPA: DUF2460 domain-containing protein [Rhizomicrobium sp.]|jgi:hypothetical protein|nr:DUF2460 domain-containing protein [Rhizomicrobium sp.]